MGLELERLAGSLGVSERTLRRCVNEGLLRGRRGARHGVLSVREEAYLRRHWPLLARLRRALRTERGVRLAVLFGSTATGESGEGSDVDILVTLPGTGALDRLAVARRLERAAGRPVHLVRLEDAERTPSLLADVLDEGRVLVDRDGEWAGLQARAGALRRAAAQHEERVGRRAAEAVQRLRAVL